MLSSKSRYQNLMMARGNVEKSRVAFRGVYCDDESRRKHQEKFNTGPKIKVPLIRRSAVLDKKLTCCKIAIRNT